MTLLFFPALVCVLSASGVKPSFLSGIQPAHAQNATDRACARSAWVGAGDKPSSVGPGGFRVPLPGWRTCRGVRPFLCARACARAGAVYPPPSARTGRRAGVAGERGLCDLARGGVCRAPTLTRRAVGFYPAVSPLPDPEEPRAIGGLFSVALSRAPNPGAGGCYPPPCPAVLGLSSERATPAGGRMPARGMVGGGEGVEMVDVRVRQRSKKIQQLY